MPLDDVSAEQENTYFQINFATECSVFGGI